MGAPNTNRKSINNLIVIRGLQPTIAIARMLTIHTFEWRCRCRRRRRRRLQTLVAFHLGIGTSFSHKQRLRERKRVQEPVADVFPAQYTPIKRLNAEKRKKFITQKREKKIEMVKSIQIQHGMVMK